VTRDLPLGAIFRRYLVTGVFTLLPLALTLWILRVIFSSLVDIFRTPLTWASQRLNLPLPPYWELAALSLVATVLALLLAGLLVGNFLGRQALNLLDEVMMHLPLVKGIYGAAKQLMGALQSGQGGAFKEVVLVEWPHPGSHTLGFVARRGCEWVLDDGVERIAVYIPTAPNPTSGYVVMIEASKVKPTDLSPDQALAWAVSGGVVAPKG